MAAAEFPPTSHDPPDTFKGGDRFSDGEHFGERTTHTTRFDRQERSRSRGGWFRVVVRGLGFVLVTTLAWIALFVVGPLGFILIFGMAWIIDRYVGRHRRRAWRVRRRALRH